MPRSDTVQTALPIAVSVHSNDHRPPKDNNALAKRRFQRHLAIAAQTGATWRVRIVRADAAGDDPDGGFSLYGRLIETLPRHTGRLVGDQHIQLPAVQRRRQCVSSQLRQIILFTEMRCNQIL